MYQFADRMNGITGSAIRELFKLLGDPNLISFGGGNPASDLFPTEEISNITADILGNNAKTILQYGGTEGYVPLRKAITEHMLRPRGLDPAEDEVITLSGSIQGISLLCEVLLNRGDAMVVESPTFLGALQTFHIYGADLYGVEMDEEGADPEHLEKLFREVHPKLYYCIPTFQNPSGRTMSVERRKRVAELAAKYNVIVIEDDPYYALRYNGTELPPIKQFDEANMVVLLSSFSKILSPGLRVGCAYGAAEILRKMAIAKQGADTHTSNLSQAIACEFLTRGCLPPHLTKITPVYADRMNSMLDAMKRYFPDDCEFTKPDGGLFIWGRQKGLDLLSLMPVATKEYKVAYIPGTHFYAHEGEGLDTFRLCFSSAKFEDIEAGISRLGQLFKATK